VLLAAGCAASQSKLVNPAAPGTSSRQTAAAAPSRAPGAPAPAARARTYRLSEAELELWRDPAFQKQFAESYVAETELEPRVTQEERDQMLKVLKLIESDKMDEAARLLERGRGASAVFDFTLANIYFQESDKTDDAARTQQKLDQAAGLYQAAAGKHPKFRRAWRNLGLVYVRQKQYDKALPALTRVIELGGGDGLTYGLLGFAYSSTDDNLPAESAYRKAILLDPITLDWKMGLARSLFKQQRYADAAALCGHLIADHPDRADLWLLQANAFIGLGQPLKAAENYELVDRLGGSTADSLNMLGDIYVNEGVFDLAVNAYVRAMEKAPAAPPVRAIRAAKVLTARGALQETRQLIEAIEKGHGPRLAADDRKDLLKLRARLAVAEGSGAAEEVRVLQEIVALDPTDGEALILLGQHSLRAGDPQKAVFYYERAASLEKYEADAKVRHAQLLVGQGKYAEALPLLRSAQALKFRQNVQEYLEQVERVAKGR
jgi:tetratricopeptide (TPR) repeat protein